MSESTTTKNEEQWERKKVSVAERQTVQWKNGRGSTMLIAVEANPSDETKQDFLWRLSSAPVTKETQGQFSIFSTKTRWLCLLEGDDNELQLDVDGTQSFVKRHEFTRFSGDATTFGWLRGERSILDLGLIVDHRYLDVHLSTVSSAKEATNILQQQQQQQQQSSAGQIQHY